jgi:hypothetical protein
MSTTEIIPGVLWQVSLRIVNARISLVTPTCA